jgi:hypothetical protein
VIEVARYVRGLIDAMGLSDAIHPMVMVNAYGPALGGHGCLEVAALQDADYVRDRLDRYHED